jgi:flavorubredoxin
LPVGIVYSTEKKVVERLANGLKRGLEEQGESVRLYPDNSETFRDLATCKHLFVGSYVTSVFKAKTPKRLREALNKIPGISRKIAIAFIAKANLGERKALLALMNDMEKHGCFMINQHSFGSEKEAYEVGKTIKLRADR